MANLEKLIQNLRRGNEIENSKKEFFNMVETQIDDLLKTLSLRWKISIVDIYILTMQMMNIKHKLW